MASSNRPARGPLTASRADADPADLGRGPLTRRLPVWGQAASRPPTVRAYRAGPTDTPGRFLARVIFSTPRITLPAMLLAVAWQIGESAVPVVTGLAIDRALATGDAGQLALWIGVLVALYVALTAAARATNRLNAHALQLLQHRLRTTLSTRVLHPVRGAIRAPDGEVVSTMTNDVSRVANAGLLLTMAISRIAAIGFITASLLALHWVLGVVVLVGAPLVVWLMGVLSRRLAHSTRVYQELLAATVGRATDLVAGYRVIKGMHAESEATRRYARASRETLTGAKRTAGLLGRFQAVSGLVNGAFVAAVTGLAGWFAVDGQLTIGGLITTVGLTQALLPQIQGIVGVSIPNVAGAHASAARVLDALTTSHATDAPPGTSSSGPSASASTVVELSMSGVTHRVDPGELVGIRADDVTASRIADALLNPHDDRHLVVRLDGHPAAQLTPAQYRSQVVVAPHRTTLFTGTVRANLTTPAGAPDRLGVAIEAAACGDFVTDLDGAVGEDGNRLSGGQRQRVALARALATDAPVLVLHDPTTAVDPVTEQAIADRLRGVRQGRSTLVITASPAWLGGCDRVIDLRTDESSGPGAAR